MRDNHKEYIAIFIQMVDLYKSLKKKVVAAIYKLYIKALQYSQTDTIIMAVAELMTRLFASYGLVNAEKLQRKKKIYPYSLEYYH